MARNSHTVGDMDRDLVVALDEIVRVLRWCGTSVVFDATADCMAVLSRLSETDRWRVMHALTAMIDIARTEAR